MLLGRKISNRIQLAYLVPLTMMLLVGIVAAALNPKHNARLVAVQLFVLMPAVVLGHLITRRISHRLYQLRKSAERIERGEYTVRLDTANHEDEFSDLARAFNHMANVISARESAANLQNSTLAGLNHRLESVLNATYDGIALLDSDGRFAIVNRRFCEILGVKPEDVLHQQLNQLGPVLASRLAQPQELTEGLAAKAASDPGSEHIAEAIIELMSPEKRFVQTYTAPVLGEDDSERIGRILALRDVTREQELDKMKTDFISVVSHELRTPLTSIKGYTDLLLSGAAGDLSELQSEFLGIIQGSNTRLANLINDILDISRIESGRIEIKHEPIDYRVIVLEVIRLLKATADEKEITCELDIPESLPLVRGDSDKVAQIVTNLVSNAIKYTPRNGWMRVSIEASGDAGIRTCVSDSGIGISQEDQKKLFQKFFRADNSSTREAGGTGLGLVIAKTLVELLGGSIWVESESGMGSRFFFTLPQCLDASVEVWPEHIILPERGIGLVLVVDDAAYVRGLVQHHLHRRGYGVIEADCVSEALQKARMHKPNVIVVNMMMSDFAGLSVLRELTDERSTAMLPVVAVTLVGDPARGLMSLGPFVFGRKPLVADELWNKIERALRSSPETGKQTDAHRSILFVVDDESQWKSFANKELDALTDNLLRNKIDLLICSDAQEAIALTVAMSPSVVVIDTDIADADLKNLCAALKAEEEAARIPIILLTHNVAIDTVFTVDFNQYLEEPGSLDYLTELLNHALAHTALTTRVL